MRGMQLLTSPAASYAKYDEYDDAHSRERIGFHSSKHDEARSLLVIGAVPHCVRS